MLDYHLHLWPHSQSEVPLSLEQIAAYCERAQAAGVVEIALTEHLFRFVQADDLLGGFWDEETTSDALRASMADYWQFHCHADLEAYVNAAQEAKAAGLPVVIGLEVDYYRDHMDKVAGLLDDYPFDVLLGSVHWVDAWRFDDLGDTVSMDEWSGRSIDASWDGYTRAMEELAASGTCDVLAHPDLIKVTGKIPDAPGEWWDRIAESAWKHGLVAEVSSAGWRKPVGEQYPALGLLERFARGGVGFTTASDAHVLDQVADKADDLRAVLGAAGITELQRFSGRRAQPTPVTEAKAL